MCVGGSVASFRVRKRQRRRKEERRKTQQPLGRRRARPSTARAPVYATPAALPARDPAPRVRLPRSRWDTERSRCQTNKTKKEEETNPTKKKPNNHHRRTTGRPLSPSSCRPCASARWSCAPWSAGSRAACPAAGSPRPRPGSPGARTSWPRKQRRQQRHANTGFAVQFSTRVKSRLLYRSMLQVFNFIQELACLTPSP